MRQEGREVMPAHRILWGKEGRNADVDKTSREEEYNL